MNRLIYVLLNFITKSICYHSTDINNIVQPAFIRSCRLVVQLYIFIA